MSHGGRRIHTLRGDNEQGPTFERQQANVRWGDRQSVAFQPGAGGLAVAPNTYFFPFPPGFGFDLPVKSFNQLVDMRYERPTTWSISLFAEAQQPMGIGDTMRILWDVFVSVGAAKNRLQFLTSFTKAAVPIAPDSQTMFFFTQLPAQTIQIVPNAISAHKTTNAKQQINWSAWVAPVVD